MLGQIDSNKTYLYIIGGKITQKVDKNTEGVVSRINKKEVEVWEKYYKFVAGKITSLAIDDTKFGKYLNININDDDFDYVLAVACESSYFGNLINKIGNLDFLSEVQLSPYHFLPKDSAKMKSGITVYQNGDSVAYAIDKNNKPEDYPVYPEGCATGDANQKKFFIEKSEWEINYIKNNTFNFFKPETKEPVPDNTNIEFQDFDNNSIGDDEVPF